LGPPAKKAPRLQAGERAVETFGNGGEGTGRLHRCDGFLLLRRCSTAFRFELEPEDAALWMAMMSGTPATTPMLLRIAASTGRR